MGQMAPDEKKKGSKPRAGGPKVKTGCANCKIRRVKCDETKPQCLNCQRRKARCPGYPSVKRPTGNYQVAIQPRPAPTAQAVVPVIAPTGSAPIRPTRPFIITPARSPTHVISAITTYTPSLSLTSNEQEWRCFELFRERTAGELSGFFESDFWTRCVLQESHSKSSIRHAVVAIGALYKTLESSHTIEAGESVSKDAKYYHEFALRQFGQAVTHLLEAIKHKERRSVRTALITHVLFICFEAFHGDHESAISQVQHGMKLLDARKKEDEEDPDSPEEGDGVENELVQMFTRLAVQAKSYDMAFHRNMSLNVQLTSFNEYNSANSPFPAVFTDMLEARRTFDDLCMQQVHFTTNYVPLWLTKRPMPQERYIQQAAIQAQVDSWAAAFEPLFQYSLTPEGSALFASAAVLRAYQINATMLWDMAFEMDECKFDRYTPKFQEIVNLSKRVIDLHKSRPWTPPSGASFSFDQALVPGLYVVGTKCRDRRLRREAIHLLLANPRREGMWDSVLAGKVAQWTMQLEEEGFGPDDFIPDSSRVTITKISFDLKTRYANVWCGSRYRLPHPTDPKYRETYISW